MKLTKEQVKNIKTNLKSYKRKPAYFAPDLALPPGWIECIESLVDDWLEYEKRID